MTAAPQISPIRGGVSPFSQQGDTVNFVNFQPAGEVVNAAGGEPEASEAQPAESAHGGRGSASGARFSLAKPSTSSTSAGRGREEGARAKPESSAGQPDFVRLPPAGDASESASFGGFAAVGRRPLALYIHYPFCVTKCPYCDFNSHVRPTHDHAAYREAILQDLAFEAALTPHHRLSSIFFGGGTPSFMDPATTAAIIQAALNHWPHDPDIEITLEANPSSVEAARFAAFRSAGVNRVSLGVQALDDRALKLLGRPHDVAAALAALDVAQAVFPRVSLDLIHTRPNQTPEDWRAELARALTLGTGHISAYQLTIEPGTRFHTLHAKGLLTLPDDEQAADMFELTGELCAAAGLPPYETSNHARPGEESRHNLHYWRYDSYVGVGPGAHGRRNRTATKRLSRPEAWTDSCRAHGHGLESEDPVAPAEAAREALLMGLRLTEGIDPDRFHANTGVALAHAIDAAGRARLADLGMVTPTGPLAATPAGRGVLNRLIAELAA